MLSNSFGDLKLDVSDLATVRDNHRISSFFWSPPGNFLATLSAEGRTLVIRDGANFQIKRPVKVSGDLEPRSVAWSPAGLQLVTGWNDPVIRILEPPERAAGRIQSFDNGHGAPTLGLAYHPNPDLRLFVSIAEGDMKINLWHGSDFRILQRLEVPGESPPCSVAWSSNGRWLSAVHENGRINLWPLVNRRLGEVMPLRQSGRLAVWAPTSRQEELGLIADDEVIRLWPVTGTPSELRRPGGVVASLSFSPDGRLLASSSYDGTICLWDVSTPIAHVNHLLEIDGAVAPSGSSLHPSLLVSFKPRNLRRRVSVLAALDPVEATILLWTVAQRPASDRPGLPRPLRPTVGPTQPMPGVPTPTAVPDDRASIRRAGLSDRPDYNDHLGFAPYVGAIAHFLSAPETRPPLTLSIEGGWGMGKSSFMGQLESALKEGGARSAGLFRRRTRPRNLTVRFNAWRHDKEEALWAAFALEFVRQLRKQLSLWRLFLAWGRLFFKRFHWFEGGLSLLRAVCAWVLILCSIVALSLTIYNYPGDILKDLESIVSASPSVHRIDLERTAREVLAPILGSSALATLVLSLLLQAWRFLGNPLGLKITEYMRSPRYEDRVNFVERFHQDFDAIVRAYGGRRRVFVFIDDLDRCDALKAADLMQGLNLLISDNPQLIFVLGMDRVKVAAGLAVKYEKLVPHLPASGSGAGHVSGIDYGSEFIEKFIQIPFALPPPSLADLREYLDYVDQVEPDGIDKAEAWASTFLLRLRAFSWLRPRENGAGSPPSLDHPGRKPPFVAPEKPFEILPGIDDGVAAPVGGLADLRLDGDSTAIKDLALSFSPFLEYNPRRLKQFMNILRLRVYIAAQTGVLSLKEGGSKGRLTIRQIGKFVVLSLRWPTFLDDLQQAPSLLYDLEQEALSSGGATLPSGSTNEGLVQKWRRREKLMQLLQWGVETQLDLNGGMEKVMPDGVGLGSLRAESLLRVSPALAESSMDLVASASPNRHGGNGPGTSG